MSTGAVGVLNFRVLPHPGVAAGHKHHRVAIPPNYARFSFTQEEHGLWGTACFFHGCRDFCFDALQVDKSGFAVPTDSSQLRLLIEERLRDDDPVRTSLEVLEAKRIEDGDANACSKRRCQYLRYYDSPLL